MAMLTTSTAIEVHRTFRGGRFRGRHFGEDEACLYRGYQVRSPDSRLVVAVVSSSGVRSRRPCRHHTRRDGRINRPFGVCFPDDFRRDGRRRAEEPSATNPKVACRPDTTGRVSSQAAYAAATFG